MSSQQQETIGQRTVKSKKPHRNLVAWQKAMDLAVNIYELTRNFPQEELYALTSQLRRAAVSAPSNIAEGAADRTRTPILELFVQRDWFAQRDGYSTRTGATSRYVTETDYAQVYQALDEYVALTYGLKKSVSRKN